MAGGKGGDISVYSPLSSMLVVIFKDSFPGTGCHGVPFIDSIISASNCSVLSCLLIDLHFKTPFGVPIICSFELSMSPIQMPDLHLPSSFGILTVYAGLK